MYKYLYAWSSLPPFAASLPSPDPVACRSSGGVAYGVHAYIFIYHPPEDIHRQKAYSPDIVRGSSICLHAAPSRVPRDLQRGQVPVNGTYV